MIGRYICRNIIKQHNNILDLGCGKGVWGDLVKDRNFYGVDIKPFNPKDYKGFVCLDIDKHGIYFNNNLFDLIIAKDIIEHLNKPEKTLQQIYKALKFNGILIVKVPDYKSKNAWEDYTHKKPYTKQSIQNILKDNGFRIKKVYKLGGHFFPSIIPQPLSWLVIAEK